MKIGSLTIANPVFLAPMAGVTDYAFRLICKHQGAGVVYSEFVSAHGVIRENSKTLDMLRFTRAERPIGIQIFGDDPQIMAHAAMEIMNRFAPDILDINYGCPVPKVTRKGAGSAALKDLCLMDDITAAVVEAVPEVPVTVKMRAGWNLRSIIIPEAGPRLEKLGVKAITLHPRTAGQKYDVMADWKLIRELKQAVTIPVIGNGDINNADDARRMVAETGCDAIMIGRAAMGNPWIFHEISEFYQGRSYKPPTPGERIEMCRKHLHLLVKDKGARIGSNLMRKHFGWYLKGFAGAATLRQKLVLADSYDLMVEILEKTPTGI